MQRILRELLKSISVAADNIEMVANGQSALSVLRDKTPDIVVCDWQMAGMSGLELIQKMRDQKECPEI